MIFRRYSSRLFLPDHSEFLLKSDALNRVFHNKDKVDNVVNIDVKDFSISKKSSLQWDSILWSLIQGSNAQPTELTCIEYLRSLSSHALFISTESSKSKKYSGTWTKSQFKDPLATTCQVSSIGWALGPWTSDHQIKSQWR